MINENYIRTFLIENPKINIVDFTKQYNLLTKNIDVSVWPSHSLLTKTPVFIDHSENCGIRQQPC